MSKYQCQICLADSNDNLINCVKCHQTYHQHCASVPEPVPHTWLCANCSSAQSETHSVRGVSSKASRASQRRRIALELQLIEEERQLSIVRDKEFLSKKLEILQKEDEADDANTDTDISVGDWLEDVHKSTNAPTVSTKTTTSATYSAAPLTTITSASYSAAPFTTITSAPYSAATITTITSPPSNQNICKVTYNLSSEIPTASSFAVTQAAMYGNKTSGVDDTANFAVFSNQPNLRKEGCSTVIYNNAQPATVSSAFINNSQPSCSNLLNLWNANHGATAQNGLGPAIMSSSLFNRSQPHLAFMDPPTQHMRHQRLTAPTNDSNSLLNTLPLTTQFRLTTEQMQARNSVPKELPFFNGNAAEWPLFSATFDWSTQVCGFTDAENLIRLQRALKGDAHESVQHILVHPSCVPTVLSTLQILYGQPERILNSLKARITATPKIDSNKLESISNFAVAVKGLLATIDSCNLQDEITNSSLLQDLVEKLPPNIQLTWGSHKLRMLRENKKASLIEFSDFVFELGMSASVTLANKSNTDLHNKVKKPTQKFHVNAHNAQSTNNCVICDDSCVHASNCPQFLNADRAAKWNIVRRFNLCKRCLKKQTKKSNCECNETCTISNCQSKHHPLLHNNNNNNDKHTQQESSNQQVANSETHLYNNNKSSEVLFKIIPIKIFGKNKTIRTFAFIDEGSSVSLLDESLAMELEINGTPHPLCLKWTGHMQRRENESRFFNLCVAGYNQKQFSIKVHTVSQLSLPPQTIIYKKLCQQYPHLKNLPISDYENATPRLLIGVNNLSLGIPLEIRESSPAAPIAVRTRLGWLIYGNRGYSSSPEKCFNFHICDCDKDASLQEMVKQFFSLESLGIKASTKPMLGIYEERAFHLLKQLTTQRADRHYETGLLWRNENVELPDSYNMAVKRLTCLERKFVREPALYNVFQNTVDDYLRKGYISKLPNTLINNENNAGRIWYLPIFSVTNPNKPGKVRIVWDAAAKSNNLSLNCSLFKGPDLLSSLPAILFRFRQKAVALSGDIQEMFHQIYVREEDKHAQRFLWRPYGQQTPPDVYVMNVLIFGAACSPSISQYVKNFNAAKFQNQYPEAARAIVRDHYVDDLLCSVDTTDEAIRLAKDVKYIHRQGGFHIRNWCSNRTEVLNALEEAGNFAEKNLAIDAEGKFEKVLGIFWEQRGDTINFRISPRLNEKEVIIDKRVPTKRDVLRVVMSIYDPLGLLGHIIMYAKILLQEIWRSHIGWDDQIKHPELIKWHNWLQTLPSLRNIRLTRCYLKNFRTYENVFVELHTFVDASENGYAAVSYFRITDGSSVVCSIVGSKTRVAPLKIASIPRLELMAALIGARYAKLIIDEHTIAIKKRFFWSDSQTVLKWLKADSRKYHQFVGLRISEILELTELCEWKYVPSKLNVADDATKWTKKPEFSEQSRWFCGPPFLYLPYSEWPKEKLSEEATTEELRQRVMVISNYEPTFDVSRFSKWLRLLRCAAYVQRFINRCKNKSRAKETSELTSPELYAAEIMLYREAQREYYLSTIDILHRDGKLSKANELYKLTPVLDEDELLRIDSRIDEQRLLSGYCNPIILPRKSAICTLIIHHYHQRLKHMNNETVINELRQKYHIGRLRATLKVVIKNCQFCKIQKATPPTPQMAKLPSARLAAFVAPFTYCGVDFFGPMLVRVNRYTEKRYGALFTCLTVRAVHVEIVHSLTTSSCIMAIRNFIARRGTPREFYSDNGTNFVGAERELREACNEIDKNKLVLEFTSASSAWCAQ